METHPGRGSAFFIVLGDFCAFSCVFLCFGRLLHVFACFCIFFCSWGALGRSWNAPGRSWDALGALLGKNTKKQRLEYKFRGVLGMGFGRVLAILNVLVKNLRLPRPSHRFFYFFGIVRELLAKARTLNFVAPVDVLKKFSEVDVLRSRSFGTRDDLRKKLHFSFQLEAKFLQNQVV